MDSCSNDEAFPPLVPPGSDLDRAAAALAHLCDDFVELEVLAHILKTFPASYGAPARLVTRLAAVSNRLWVIHDGKQEGE